MQNPFALVPEKTKRAPVNPLVTRTYQEVDSRGHVMLMKKESGIPVVLEDLGHIKDQFNLSIWKAAMRPVGEELTSEEINEISAVDAAAISLARQAAYGDLSAINSLFDRVLGKPKQTTESSHVNLNIDAILTGDGVETLDITPGE